MIKTWLTPQSQSPVLDAIGDTVCSRSDLIVENALLRQQLIVLKRQIKRSPVYVVGSLANGLADEPIAELATGDSARSARHGVALHRELCKHFWSGKSRHTGGKQALAAQVVALIKRIASENRLWDAERIRGEPLKLDIHVSKRTI